MAVDRDEDLLSLFLYNLRNTAPGILQDVDLLSLAPNDFRSVLKTLTATVPDEIYNLGAQSHVQVSFETPEYTAQADALGPLRILESIRILNLTKKTKLYQASTSELFGEPFGNKSFTEDRSTILPKYITITLSTMFAMTPRSWLI